MNYRAFHYLVLLQYDSAPRPHRRFLARLDLALASLHRTSDGTASDHDCVVMLHRHDISAYLRRCTYPAHLELVAYPLFLSLMHQLLVADSRSQSLMPSLDSQNELSLCLFRLGNEQKGLSVVSVQRMAACFSAWSPILLVATESSRSCRRCVKYQKDMFLCFVLLAL